MLPLLFVAAVGCKSVKSAQGSEGVKNGDNTILNNDAGEMESTVNDKTLQVTPGVEAAPIQNDENNNMRKSEIKVVK